MGLNALVGETTLSPLPPIKDHSLDLLAKHFHNFAPKIYVSSRDVLLPPIAPIKQTLPLPPMDVHPVFETYVQTPPPTEAPVSKQFTCRWYDCSDSFATRSGLATHCSAAHLLTHLGAASPKRQRVSICCRWNGCNEEFSTLKQLTKHLALSDHIGQTPYLSKQQEMEAIEEEDALQQRRKYPCSFPGCGKRFTDSSNRKKHERTHDANRPRYQCTETGCTKSYTTRADLNVHLRVHRKDRANVCTYPNCGKAFVRTSELYAHERTHDNMLPHNCDKCGRSFREKSRLTKHQKVSHSEANWAESPQESPYSSPLQTPEINTSSPQVAISALSQLYVEACLT